MKLWKNLDPRLRRSLMVLTWSAVGVVALYAVLTVVLTMLTRNDFFGGLFTLLVMAVLSPVMLVILLAVVNYIRYRLTAKYGVYLPDRKLDRTLSVMAVLGFAAAVVCVLGTALLDLDVRYPWNTHPVEFLFGLFAILFFIIGGLALMLNFAVQLIFGFLKKKRGEEKMARYGQRVRIASGVLLGLILGVYLLIPVPQGRYNDGPQGRGSEYYAAPLYEVIDWNRAPAKDAMAVPEDFDPDEEQRIRIYFFPFNCYTYEAKWKMKH